MLALLLTLLLAATTTPPTEIRLDITRDTWVSTDRNEAEGNNGGADRLKTKGIQEFALFDIDPAPLRGHVITAATLHFKPVGSEIERRLTVSTLAAEWGEGTATRYTPQVGGASFVSPVGDKSKLWAYPGSDITAVMNGIGNTLWSSADATPPDAQGWQTVTVDPRVVAARVAGVSHGFVLFDDIGSEYQRDGEKFTYRSFLNRYISSREAGKSKAPYLTVTLGEADEKPPAVIEFAKIKKVDPTDLRLIWRTPNDDGLAGVAGYFIRYSKDADKADWDHATPVPRYLIPMAGKAGGQATFQLRDVPLPPSSMVWVGVRAVDAAGNLGPVSSATLPTPGPRVELKLAAPVIEPFIDTGPNPKLGDIQVSVIDPLDKLQPQTGELIPQHAEGYTRANHLWSAGTKTIRLFAGRNEFVSFQVMIAGKVRGLTMDLQFPHDEAMPRAELLRFRNVMAKRGPLPDPLVLFESLDVPAVDEKMDGQKFASVLADVYVPHDAKPGIHHGKLIFTAGGQTLTLGVELHVWGFALPDRLSFVPEMNCYSLPGPPLELEYYRLAQVHRTNLNRLAYNWAGRIHDGCGPVWDGKRFDWDAWDRRFGPLLDGSAFKDLPRGGIPVEAFYLPLNENWPAGIDRGFIGGYWPDAALTVGYRDTIVEASRQFAEHFVQNKWNQTLAEFFLNGKVYFKKTGWSVCSAPWIFDEPVNTQDFEALRWYGAAFQEGVSKALVNGNENAERPSPWPSPGRGGIRRWERGKMVFRCDISRPQWQRDLLDDVMDVNVVSGAFAKYRRMISDRREKRPQVVINYGGSNNIEDANTQPAMWCLEAWCRGADGVLPWQTVGNAKSWEKADAQSLFYPPLQKGDGPLASVRLKAYRQGQQDVEYLTMLGEALHVSRETVAQMVQRELKLVSEVQSGGAEDAGTAVFSQADAAVKMWRLRVRVGAMLEETAGKPAR